jgi:hypothetical protein
MKLKIEIVMDNAAFGACDQDNYEECARILRDLSEYLDNCNTPRLEFSKPLQDGNGNTCGKAKVTR